MLFPKYIYAFRGLVAFVAFIDLADAVKAFVEKKCLLNDFSTFSKKLLSIYIAKADTSALPRIYGVFAILHALILIHCALFIHYKPLVSLGVCSLTLSIMMYLTETMIFHTTLFNFRIIFPCVLNGITALGLLLTLRLKNCNDDENMEILKKTKIYRKNACGDKWH